MRHRRSRFAWAFVPLALAFSHVDAVPVDLELSLVIDVSPSVNDTEYELTLDGYEAAFKDPAVQAAIAALPGGIASNIIFFSENAVEKIGWTHLTDATSADAFADAIALLSRTPPVISGTDIAEGYDLAIGSFVANGFEGERFVIDISGDGPQNLNGGCPAFGNGTDPACVAQTDAARAAAEAAGIIVNGLVIGPDDPLFSPRTGVEYYEDFIITSDGFALAATDFTAFAPIVRDKIFREITDTVPEPLTLFLTAGGLIALSLCRREKRDTL